MKKIIALFALTFALTGCASNSDIQKLQSEIDGLNSKVAAADSKIDAVNAKCELKHAECEKHCKTLESKLDRVFKKAQLK